MKALRVLLRLGLLSGLGIAFSGSPTRAQNADSKGGSTPSTGIAEVGRRRCEGANDLDKAIEAANKCRSLGGGDAGERNCSRCGRRSRGRSISRP